MRFLKPIIVCLSLSLLFSCSDIFNDKTVVTIKGNEWYFNNKLTNAGSPAEGMLMNVRMVNSVFEDLSGKILQYDSLFNSDTNTDTFVSKIPEYASTGVNAFTISLQGGLPGYEGAINTAFNPDGSVREEYLARAEKVINTCGRYEMAIILSCFYQRQHSHKLALDGKSSIRNAVKNTVNWITEKKFTNVLLEISNEYEHKGFNNWIDGEWLRSEEGQIELVKLAKGINPSLLVSTSGSGNGKYKDILANEVDFILIHFNNTSIEDYKDKINALKKFDKPIVCNEDTKLGHEGVKAIMIEVLNGCSGGYMYMKKNQVAPFEFDGSLDDTLVYQVYKNLTSPDFNIVTDNNSK